MLQRIVIGLLNLVLFLELFRLAGWLSRGLPVSAEVGLIEMGIILLLLPGSYVLTRWMVGVIRER